MAVRGDGPGAAPADRRPPTWKDGQVDTAAVEHDPDGLDQVLWATAENPSSLFLFLRVGLKRDDVMSAGARIYRIGDSDFEAFKDFEMEPYALTADHDYRSVTIPFDDSPTADDLHSHWRGYRLWLDDNDRIFWVGRPDSVAPSEGKVERFKQLFRPKTSLRLKYGGENPSDSGVSDRLLLIPAWSQDAVFYRIHIDRFRNGDPGNDPPGALSWGAPPTADGRYGGDLKGVLDALPYLDSLGVNALCLSPIFATAEGLEEGVADLDSVEKSLGDKALLKELLDAAHKRKMKVILEGSLGHVSETHPYFQDAVAFGLESDLWTWFKFQGFPVVRKPRPNYAAWKDDARLPSWNLDNPDTRNYLINVVRGWLDLSVDGWAVQNPDEAPHEFWFLFREAAKAMNSRAYVAGEVAGDTRTWNKGDQFDAVADDRFREACLGFFADTTLDAALFDETLSRIRVDTPDPLNRIAFQSLDRPGEERLTSRFAGREAFLRLMVLFQLTYTGAPVIGWGDEEGMVGDPGPRGSFPWRLADQNAPLREFYRRAILLRREHPALRRGSFTPVYADGGLYAFVRRSAEEVLLVVLNRTAGPATFKLPLPRGAVAVSQKDAVDLLTGARHAIRSRELYIKDIPAFTGAVLRLR